MLKWFLGLGVLVAIGYQICVSVVHPVPTELEERDKVAVLDAIGHIGNNVVSTLVVQCSKCMDIITCAEYLTCGSKIFFPGLDGPRWFCLCVGGGLFWKFYYMKFISFKFSLGLDPGPPLDPRLTWRLTKSRLFLSLLHVAVDGGEVWGGPGGLQTSQTIGGQCLLSDPERSVPGTQMWR